MKSMWQRIKEYDDVFAEKMADIAIPLLRISLGITYIWFGALKVIGLSPISDMVAKTIFFIPRNIIVPLLGLWEVGIGVALLLRKAMRLTLLLYFAQIAGTFLTFILRPKDMLQHGNPLLLTKDGEFVVKNLVLLSAGLAIGSTIRREREDLPDTDDEVKRRADV